jgi:hypothetical protein
MDAETATKFARLDALIEKCDDSDWNEFMDLCEWSRGRESELKAWRKLCLDSIIQGGMQ